MFAVIRSWPRFWSSACFRFRPTLVFVQGPARVHTEANDAGAVVVGDSSTPPLAHGYKERAIKLKFKYFPLAMVGLAAANGWAAVQTFTDQRSPAPGDLVNITVQLTDPFTDVKPIEHVSRAASLNYWYSLRPEQNPAKMFNGFSAQIEFSMDSSKTSYRPDRVGLGIDLLDGPPTPYREGVVRQTLLDDQSHVLQTESYEIALSGDGRVGYGFGMQIPNSIGQHFVYRLDLQVLENGQPSVGAVDAGAVLQGFGVYGAAVPEPGAAALAASGLGLVALVYRRRLRGHRPWADADADLMRSGTSVPLERG